MAREYGNSEHGLEGDNRYMAPELLMDCGKSPAMDIFSLGIMVLQITYVHLYGGVPCSHPRRSARLFAARTVLPAAV
jgi:serine/threonine protein kinase